MPRPKGSAKLGQVRSLRLPLELDEWFERRLREDVRRCASDVLLEAVHGGLRLQPGYMWRQRVTLTSLAAAGEWNLYDSYLGALGDTFGSAYVKHIVAWLQADGILPSTTPERASLPASSSS